MPGPSSLPLDGAGRLAGDVQGDAVDAGDLVDDAVAYLLEKVVGEARPVRGHGVVRGYGPNDHGVGVGPRVAHDADGVDGREDGEALPEVAVEARGPDLLLQDGVGPAQDLQPLRRNVAYHPDREPRSRERLAPHEPLRHTQLRRHHPYLVLEQVPQRLYEIEVHHLGQSADVVVALYLRRIAGAALYDVRIERALDQEGGVLYASRLLLEGADKLLADNLALRLGVCHPGELVQETPLGVYAHERHLGVLPERLDHLLGLVLAQEPVVHKDARKVVPDGPVDEHGRRRGVDPAGEAADGPPVADLPPYPLDGVGDDVDGCPVRLAAARLEEEVLEDLHPVLGMPDLRVELDADAPPAPRWLLEGDDRDRRRFRGHPEALGGGEDRVAVAGPRLLLVRRAGEEDVMVLDYQVRAAVL